MPRHSRSHPAARFVAPKSIPSGKPLADIIDRRAIELLAESMEAVVPNFESSAFVRSAVRGLHDLTFMERGLHIARALAERLPSDFNRAAKLLVKSLGPELQATQGNGLATFFYLPHSQFISLFAAGHCASGLNACYELTKRFTAEFCIRPLLLAHEHETLAELETWITDANPHVRRCVSEGTRPRLPWGMRLKSFQADPTPTLRLLDRLIDDPEDYVYRSVANHLGDILKDNPEIGYATCERWLEETPNQRTDPARRKTRFWVLRHALRHPDKKGEPRAVKLRRAAKEK